MTTPPTLKTTAGAPPVVRAAGRPGSPLPVVPAAPNTSPPACVVVVTATAGGEPNVVLESRRKPLGGGQRLHQDHTPGRGRQAPAGPPPDQAAWIRATVWTQPMRKQFTEVPGFYLVCACQYGLTTYCREGQHDRCHRPEPLRSDAASILRRGGIHPAHFREPYAYKTDTSATGPQFTSVAQVWLADRVCRWICPCGCGHVGKPVADQEQGDDGTSRPIVQLDIFGELVGA